MRGIEKDGAQNGGPFIINHTLLKFLYIVHKAKRSVLNMSHSKSHEMYNTLGRKFCSK